MILPCDFCGKIAEYFDPLEQLVLCNTCALLRSDKGVITFFRLNASLPEFTNDNKTKDQSVTSANMQKML